MSALWLGGIGRHLRSDAPGASSPPRRQDHRNDCERYPLSQTGVRDSLVGSFHGVATRCFQIDRSSPLAGIRTATAPAETFQPLQRPILRRKGSRHCWSVSESAPRTRWCCALTSRASSQALEHPQPMLPIGLGYLEGV